LKQWIPAEAAVFLDRLLTVQNFIFEDEGRIRSSLRMRQGAELSDELIVDRCRAMAGRILASHDKGMFERHRGFVLIQRCPHRANQSFLSFITGSHCSACPSGWLSMLG
jgi:hypothetical protein